MMSFPRRLRFFALLALAVPVFAAADMESQAPAKAKETRIYFVGPDSVDVAKVLPQPPEAGSLAALADLEVVLRMQASRTPEEVAFAQMVANDDVYDFSDVLGPWFAAKNLPYTAIFLKHLGSDSAAVSSATKHLFSRPRPPAVDPTVHPCVEVLTSFSYPSGHSMRAFLWAAVLSEIYPDKREALFARAHRAAWARVIGGVHFPTDIVGGRLLAARIVAELMKNPAFHDAVKQAQAESAPFLEKKAA